MDVMPGSAEATHRHRLTVVCQLARVPKKLSHDDTALDNELRSDYKRGGLLLDQPLATTKSCALRVHLATTFAVHMPWVT